MKKYLTRALPVAVGVASVVALSACSSVGDVSDPVVRKLTWFSFMSGDDLKPQCFSGLDHLRFIHNAEYKQDMRVIELAIAANGTATVNEEVYSAIDWTNITIGGEGNRRPWEPDKYNAEWEKRQVEDVMNALSKDDAFMPLAKDIPLHSAGFFWVVTGCHNGQWAFKAWAYPSPGYEGLIFPEVLEANLPAKKPFRKAINTKDDFPADERKETPFYVTSANANGVKGRMQLPQPPFKRFMP